MNSLGLTMFSGIVEDCGTVTGCSDLGVGKSLTLLSKMLSLDSVCVGESIAVDGVCLTVVGITPEGWRFDLSEETLERSRFKCLRVGEKVNLERAIPANGRFSGHFVAGHVDGLGRVVSFEMQGEFAELQIEIPKPLIRYCAGKGSIAINGVSLTINSLAPPAIYASIVPHTLTVTNLGDLKVGDFVNLEVDMIARYLEKLLEHDVAHE